MKKYNIAPLCGIFKRHSPSRHHCWLLFCKESFRPRPRFLCDRCTQYQGQEKIKPLSRRRPPRRAPIIDEMHGYKADIVIVDEMHPKKKIGFIGYNNYWTRTYLRQFGADNAEQVLHFDDRRGRLFLRDGTVVEAITDRWGRDGVRYDQVIIADDRRKGILFDRADEMAWLRNITAYTHVPEEYRFQFYDTDAGQPRKEAEKNDQRTTTSV